MQAFRNRYTSRIEICEADKAAYGSKQLFLPIWSMELSQSLIYAEKKKNVFFMDRFTDIYSIKWLWKVSQPVP